VNLGRWIGFLILAAALYTLWEIRQIMLLIFAAVVLANSLNLLAQTLETKRIQRPLAVLLAVGCFVGVLIIFGWMIVPPFVKQFQELLLLVPAGSQRANAWLDQVGQQLPVEVRPYLPNLDSLGQDLKPYINGLLGRSVAIFSSSLGAIVNILLVLVLGLMLLVNPLAYRRVFIRLFPSFYRRRIDQILKECEIALGRWMVGALISMSVVAVLSTIGLWIIGVPAALAQGILAGLLNFIPNIGPTLSVVLPMSISLVDGMWWKPIAVFVLYFLVQQFESNLLTPYVMAQQLSLLPAITLMAQVFFATVFGFLGLAFAIPLTVVSQIWLRHTLLEDVLDEWTHPGVDQFGRRKRDPKIASAGDLPALASGEPAQDALLQPDSSSADAPTPDDA
jgi:predicted PurR-regulated permease PerM